MRGPQGRVLGFVVGSDDIGGTLTWKVRINDKYSKMNGEKLIVGSIHDNIALDTGLEVTFLVGKYQGRYEEYYKAMDVIPTVMTPRCNLCESSNEIHPAEVVIESSLNDQGAASYVYTCLPHMLMAVKFAKAMFPNKSPRLKILNYYKGEEKMRPLYG